ncbi:mechanosensitive ion channel family protein [Polycyclovorans algicola]|uniref:mechanosensitive ion channel family protein n=1 Tax=Polycyclovorans algicola TaxID=616992 RepID=UPI0004A710C5|nr:mechanosensitive ion channel domain-containing protein [Polycyclovorans algicola]
MNVSLLVQSAQDALGAARLALASPDTYWQLAAVLVAIGLGWLLSARITDLATPGSGLNRLLDRLEGVLRPALSLPLLLVATALSDHFLGAAWLAKTATVITLLWLFESVVRRVKKGSLMGRAIRMVGVPLLALHFLGLLAPVTAVLDSMSFQVGNLSLSVSGLLRVLIFGSLLFWLGWVSNSAGLTVIRNQQDLDVRTREVVAKLFQIGLTLLVMLLFLQVMGINLTALAVFGGALGVGLGFGLQSIASNFISGIIILFDRSLSVGDYVELEDGKTGYVRELTMRYTTLEGFDGKDVLVPNESFITKPFTNWTHKNKKQRYRVDFSVAYHTDIRAMCELIRAAVAQHPQVISGPDIPFEERPDCEIDSFGDSGVNMFVEFWMEGVDDGKNRVGGDLLLLIFETLREHGIEIPFPQREVRMLDGRAPEGGQPPAA